MLSVHFFRKIVKDASIAFLLVIMFLMLPIVIHCDEEKSPHHEYIYFPKELPPWNFRMALGGKVSYIPQVIAEEEINQAPFADVYAKFGLPYDFTANAHLSTMVLTNHLQFGLQWSYTFTNVTLSAGWDMAYWLGFISLPGFDVIANSFIHYPNISIGYDFAQFLVSLKAEAILITFDETFAGEASVGGNTRIFAGYAFTYVIEQPFFKNTSISLGAKLNYTKFAYQSWVAFSTFEEMIIFPEFFFGLIL